MSQLGAQNGSLIRGDSGLALGTPVEPYERRLTASVSYALDEGGRLFMGESEVNKTLQRITLLRRTLIQMNPVQAMEMLVKKLGEAPSNAAFLEKIALVTR